MLILIFQTILPLTVLRCRVSAAEARIQSFLASQGKTALPPPPKPAAAVAAPVAAAAVAPPAAAPAAPAAPAAAPAGDGFLVTIDWDGTTHSVRCGPDTTVLEAAMDAGIDLPHSCMSGSCLTCPARLSSGTVDQSEGVLEDEQTAKGLMLTCVSYPLSDLSFTVIEESDLDE
jgi:ferredoxin